MTADIRKCEWHCNWIFCTIRKKIESFIFDTFKKNREKAKTQNLIYLGTGRADQKMTGNLHANFVMNKKTRYQKYR